MHISRYEFIKDEPRATFAFVAMMCVMLIASCYSARNVSYYECNYQSAECSPMTKKELPKSIMSSLNAWGNTGWLFDEACKIQDGTEEIIQVRLRNRSERKTICYNTKLEGK